MTLEPDQLLAGARAAILAHLATQDDTHMGIVAATHECHSSVSLALRALHAAGEIHIAAYTLKQYRHIKLYRLGAGVDAEKVDVDNAMIERSAQVLELLKNGDQTRRGLTDALKWSSSTTFSVISYMRENRLMHVHAKIKADGSRCDVHQYRAGAGDDNMTPAPKRPSRAKPKTPKAKPPPLVDPLMAAFFGR